MTLDRRELLSTIGTGMAVAVAGCSGDSSGSDEYPDFEGENYEVVDPRDIRTLEPELGEDIQLNDVELVYKGIDEVRFPEREVSGSWEGDGQRETGALYEILEDDEKVVEAFMPEEELEGDGTYSGEVSIKGSLERTIESLGGNYATNEFGLIYTVHEVE